MHARAVGFCHTLAGRLAESVPGQGPAPGGDGPPVSAGVASVAVVPNRFAADTLIDGAMRCLASAAASTTSAVKSIEVY
ncbi:MAG: hypothetical protein AAF790_06960 [Planctomycetota bacterium]